LGYFLIIGIYVLIVTDQPDVTKVKEGGEVVRLVFVSWSAGQYSTTIQAKIQFFGRSPIYIYVILWYRSCKSCKMDFTKM